MRSELRSFSQLWEPVRCAGLVVAEVIGDQAVTLNLVTGLESLEEAGQTYEQQVDLKAFDAAVQLGASSNLCDALLGFSGAQHNRTFEITVTAAPGPLCN